MKNKLIILLFCLILWVNCFAGASRDFEVGDTEYAALSSALVTAVPCTIISWVNPESVVSSRVLNIGLATNAAFYFNLNLYTDNKLYAIQRGGTNTYTTSSTTWSTSAWSFIAGVFIANNSRVGFLNNQKDTNTTATTWTSNPDNSQMGCRISSSTPQDYFDGLSSQTAIWNTNLSDDEINELYLGIPAIYVKTANCVAYYPMQEASGNIVDKSGNGKTMTETSGTIDVSSNSPPKIFIPMGGQ